MSQFSKIHLLEHHMEEIEARESISKPSSLTDSFIFLVGRKEIRFKANTQHSPLENVIDLSKSICFVPVSISIVYVLNHSIYSCLYTTAAAASFQGL